ncbi:putative Na+/phosphate symporter [Blyttiomyces helicus]|uniref:Putative Na+/phosphate symporter n=1 Tax=Blyttiomyces helicus TaxID=388810 RepID=A0A4P9WM06_9FUNG|nr:putative Na+/phosphate symporter [Blyttiomyces helicus]|eukprot:RKO94089.1 putative Na+/phosphate symporter [Blyttiomyces helicus]
MVTTGVQRGFGDVLRIWLEHNLRSRWRAFLAGIGITALLQSSTATGLMASAFTADGLIGLGPALVVMLGANLGTTLVTQVLSFNAGLIGPPLALLGVMVFRSGDDDRLRNAGQIAIGLGLMLLALSGMVHELAPIEDAPLLKSVLSAVGSEPLLAVAVATILTWACHSSVAVVLLVISLAATQTLSVPGALAFVVGANIGGTLPALLEAGSPIARRLPLGNTLIRVAGAVVALPLISICVPLLAHIDAAPSRIVVNFHTAFNLLLAIVFIGPSDWLARSLIRILPNPPAPNDPGKPVYLEEAGLGAATVALANASRETLRMGDLVEAMLKGASDVFQQADARRAGEISRMDRSVDRLGAAIRSYLADLGNEQPLSDDSDGSRVQEILSAVINLEHVGDVVANSLLEFAVRRIKRGWPFSSDEQNLIASMIAEILESLRIGLAVFLTRDASQARRLVGRKSSLRRLEVRATELHVQWLRAAATTARADAGAGVARVAEEGSQFLRIVRDLRRVHSHIASLAYPILNNMGGESAAPASIGLGDRELEESELQSEQT